MQALQDEGQGIAIPAAREGRVMHARDSSTPNKPSQRRDALQEDDDMLERSYSPKLNRVLFPAGFNEMGEDRRSPEEFGTPSPECPSSPVCPATPTSPTSRISTSTWSPPPAPLRTKRVLLPRNLALCETEAFGPKVLELGDQGAERLRNDELSEQEDLSEDEEGVPVLGKKRKIEDMERTIDQIFSSKFKRAFRASLPPLAKLAVPKASPATLQLGIPVNYFLAGAVSHNSTESG